MRTIQASALIAISTPAQNPRGSARSTRSTGDAIPRRGYCRRVVDVDLPVMPTARVLAVAPGSAAACAGVLPGDELLAVNGEAVRDVIRYHLQADEPRVVVELRRGG